MKICARGGMKQIETDEGEVRRSSRMRYRPLEYWRNERVVFGRRKSGPFPVPVIQEIVRVPECQESAIEKREKKIKQRQDFIKRLNPMVKVVVSDDKEDLKGAFSITSYNIIIIMCRVDCPTGGSIVQVCT